MARADGFGGRCDGCARPDGGGFDRAAAHSVEHDGIVIGRPLGGIVCAFGDGRRGSHIPAAEGIALPCRFGRSHLRAVFADLDGLLHSVIQIPRHGVLVPVIVHPNHGGAVRGDGLLFKSPGGKTGIFVGAVRGHGLRGALPGFRGTQFVRAVQFLQIVLHGVLCIRAGNPFCEEHHTLCFEIRLAEGIGKGRGHRACTSGIWFAARVIDVPTREGIALFHRILRPGDGSAHAAGELRYGGTAHGVKADVPQPLRIAPCDMDDLLDGLGGE